MIPEWAWSLFWFCVKSYLVVRVFKCLYILSKSFIVHVVWPKYNLDHLKDSWTVFTGATDGIGRAYIEELARSRGIRKFYLIGRSEKKLNDVSNFLKKAFNAEVRTAIFDFDSSDYSKLPTDLETLDVGILVNCVGIAPDKVGNLVELEKGLASKIMRVNLMGNVQLIERILPGMVQRDRGVIVNVSSMTGWRPFPYLSTYPSSKAAFSFFSDALSDEFSKTNVRIQCLIPLLVATKAASYDISEANDLFVVSPENFAKQAVNAIGNWTIMTGCFQHDVQIAIGTLLSFSFFKLLYVPLILLGVHKDRVANYQRTHQKNE